MSARIFIIQALLVLFTSQFVSAIDDMALIQEIPARVYPEINQSRPDLPSPFLAPGGLEYVVAVNREGKFAVVPVTPGNEWKICRQLDVDSVDFPSLSATGIHSESDLNHIRSITGRSLDEINRLGRPGGLSHDGFMAGDETVVSVLKADNRIVQRLGLTHPQMARPLFHLLNLLETDMELGRWNMARHSWENIRHVFYNGRKVCVEGYDTKGGQLSIFDDGLEGSFHIRIWRELEPGEERFLKELYSALSPSEFSELARRLSFLNTGELQPQYIMRYGFYEGHTYWRTDPIAIAFIFGMKTLAEIESAFKGNLDSIMTVHFTE